MKTISLFSWLLAFILAGCTTGPTLSNPASAPQKNFAALQKEMTAAQVKALLGEPDKIKPLKTAGLALASEVWVYHRKVAETVRQVPLGTRDVPATNPRNGADITNSEPVYNYERIRDIEVIELLMIENRLTEWKSHRETERAID